MGRQSAAGERTGYGKICSPTMTARHPRNPSDTGERCHHVLDVACLIGERLRLDRPPATSVRNFLPLRTGFAFLAGTRKPLTTVLHLVPA